jgi:hypothetical protein
MQIVYGFKDRGVAHADYVGHTEVYGIIYYFHSFRYTENISHIGC